MKGQFIHLGKQKKKRHSKDANPKKTELLELSDKDLKMATKDMLN